MNTGAVLYIGEGKGGDALEGFAKKLRHSKCKIKAAAVDLAPSYSAWLRENLPNTDIVYDHFHLIKLMNEKINAIRRNTMNKLDKHLKSKLKGERWLFLRNMENLNQDETTRLEELKLMFDDLDTACFFKEALRKTYSIAELALNYWCKLAVASEIPSIKTMANTIKKTWKALKDIGNITNLQVQEWKDLIIRSGG
jgi:transposase